MLPKKSEAIRLSAGKTYYIEAFAEQLLLDEHLSVVWQPPDGMLQIIGGRYLTRGMKMKDAQARLSPTESYESIDELHRRKSRRDW